MSKERCKWAQSKEMIRYHDTVWGVPVKSDRKLFEKLTLDGAQAGLSWETILKRKAGYTKAFFNFEIEKLAKLTDAKLEKILKDPGIIRNRLKVFSVRSNAQAFLKVRKEFGTFSKYLWAFVDGKPLVNKWKRMSELPANTALSDAISKDLKKRGFSFVGSTIVYAYMQAIGMVNDHTVDCFRYTQCGKK